MRAAAFLLLLGLMRPADAAPLTLICNVSLTMDGQRVDITGETAILDLENQSFKPPFYPEFRLLRVRENELSFGGELPEVSTWGSLDRVSGSLSMNVMRPQERKNLQAGATVKFLAWMTAKCVPAKRMF